MSDCCSHKFVYGGVKFKATYKLSGSSASERCYYDWYYCSHCLSNVYKALNFRDTTYDPVQFNATPIQESHD